MSFAFSVIGAFSSLEIGQPALAFSTASSNAALFAFGILTVVSRCDEVTENPASPFSRLTIAVVSMLRDAGMNVL